MIYKINRANTAATISSGEKAIVEIPSNAPKIKATMFFGFVLTHSLRLSCLKPTSLKSKKGAMTLPCSASLRHWDVKRRGKEININIAAEAKCEMSAEELM
ncbi:MAG: hypothetical protein IKT54_00395 [Clostridia bacterium]|nr:hypothetical protein [Clostridia bacterium]